MIDKIVDLFGGLVLVVSIFLLSCIGLFIFVLVFSGLFQLVTGVALLNDYIRPLFGVGV